ncbi:hypothetical protein EYD45_04130 [Hyunsoonleella flava]|uniref:Uncharacterized protein n=1 Tax=Hyunsoonleella flava TaxID=2527939 RepID=A0A4Q9FIV2_9FLAO|nr:hypothetical protein [Hyunsoonleella flava]TBN05472.1 hypothetical protein EYD45_04130 [Hyunsoonleella flava]
MKKILLLTMSLFALVACNNDDDENTTEPPLESFDYNETLGGDLSNVFDAPTNLAFVVGNNTVNASQSSSDVDYFTFTVPSESELIEITLDDYQSTDDAAFIGIVAGSAFSNDASSTGASDLLGGTLYGVSNRGNDILASMGTLGGAQGFTGALGSGNYTIWLNQTGASSEAFFNFKIRKAN